MASQESKLKEKYKICRQGRKIKVVVLHIERNLISETKKSLKIQNHQTVKLRIQIIGNQAKRTKTTKRTNQAKTLKTKKEKRANKFF